MNGQSRDESDAVEPVIEKGGRCRSVAGQALSAFLAALERQAPGGTISIEQARRVAAAMVAADPGLAKGFERSEAQCGATFALANVERQRQDHLARLVTQAFAHLLDDPATGLERRHLERLFTAMRMMLGDEIHAELKERCAAIAEAHRDGQGLVDWAGYHADPQARVVLETVLVTIAKSFRRFEPRKDWFLIMMSSSPSAVSVGSNAFIPRRPEERSKQFTETHLVRLFEAMFEPMRANRFDAAARTAFTKRFGAAPETVFGPLFVEIRAMASRRGG